MSDIDLSGSPFETLDPRFAALINPSATLERLATGCRWTEGPAYFPAGRYLVWSDVPNDRILRWDESTGMSRSSGRRPATPTATPSIARAGWSAASTSRAGSPAPTSTARSPCLPTATGQRLNSPNDVVVRSDGSVWFTDPSYGIDRDYEGMRQERELDGCHVYRIDPDTLGGQPRRGGLRPAQRPRLLARRVAALHRRLRRDPRPRRAAPYPRVRPGRRPDAVRRRGLRHLRRRLFDGFRFDEAGRLWTSAGDGVHCFEPDGTLIGKIRVPETVSNVCFGGPQRNRLFITATTSLYSVYLLLRGAKTF